MLEMKPHTLILACISTLMILAASTYFLSANSWLSGDPIVLKASSSEVASPTREPATASVRAGRIPDTPRMQQRSEVVDLQALHAAMRDSNPYAAYVAWVQARRPGTYALAWHLAGSCSDAIALIQEAELGLSRESAESDSESALVLQRQQAANEIRSRCATFRESRGSRVPSDDDADGRAFMGAYDRLLGGAAFQLDDWRVLAEQDALYLAGWYLRASAEGPPRFFDGVQIAADPDSILVYNAALSIAADLATSGQAGSQASLLELARCARSGRCERGIEGELRSVAPTDEALRAKILALYPRILLAITRGDVRAFAPPS